MWMSRVYIYIYTNLPVSLDIQPHDRSVYPLQKIIGSWFQPKRKIHQNSMNTTVSSSCIAGHMSWFHCMIPGWFWDWGDMIPLRKNNISLFSLTILGAALCFAKYPLPEAELMDTVSWMPWGFRRWRCWVGVFFIQTSGPSGSYMKICEDQEQKFLVDLWLAPWETPLMLWSFAIFNCFFSCHVSETSSSWHLDTYTPEN